MGQPLLGARILHDCEQGTALAELALVGDLFDQTGWVVVVPRLSLHAAECGSTSAPVVRAIHRAPCVVDDRRRSRSVSPMLCRPDPACEERIVGYTTDFIGHVDIEPPLNEAEQAYLTAFASS